MIRVAFLLLTAFATFCLTSGLDLRGKIQWNEECPNFASLGSAKVLLDGGHVYGSITKNGDFVIPDVEIGTYVLSVSSHGHLFDSLRIDVRESDSVPEVRPYVWGTPMNPPSTVALPYPITLSARHKNVYFVPRESFNLIAMFQNPMMLMMVFAGGVMLAMPYIMKNMDPDTLEEFKGRQARVSNIQNSLASGDIKSGISALLAGDEEPKGAVSTGIKTPVATATHSKKGGNKGRRR